MELYETFQVVPPRAKTGEEVGVEKREEDRKEENDYME